MLEYFLLSGCVCLVSETNVKGQLPRQVGVEPIDNILEYANILIL